MGGRVSGESKYSILVENERFRDPGPFQFLGSYDDYNPRKEFLDTILDQS